MNRGGKARGKQTKKTSGNYSKKRFNSSGNGEAQKKSTPKKKSNPDEIRLNKFVANSGVCSRREADLYIETGSVWVNGKPVTEMGYKVKLTDEVRFDGRLITPEKKEYILLNKPKGFLTTSSFEKNNTVMQLVANATRSAIKPVGRLERNTTGLLLFTNDDVLMKKLTHHKSSVRKIYHIELDKNFKLEDLKRLEKGIMLDEGFIKPDEVTYVEGASKREIGIRLQSAKNEIVRKVFAHLNYDVIRQDRVIFGGLTKKDLPRGRWRSLTEQEIINLKNE